MDQSKCKIHPEDFVTDLCRLILLKNKMLRQLTQSAFKLTLLKCAGDTVLGIKTEAGIINREPCELFNAVERWLLVFHPSKYLPSLKSIIPWILPILQLSLFESRIYRVQTCPVGQACQESPIECYQSSWRKVRGISRYR